MIQQPLSCMISKGTQHNNYCSVGYLDVQIPSLNCTVTVYLKRATEVHCFLISPYSLSDATAAFTRQRTTSFPFSVPHFFSRFRAFTRSKLIRGGLGLYCFRASTREQRIHQSSSCAKCCRGSTNHTQGIVENRPHDNTRHMTKSVKKLIVVSV